MKFLHRFSNKGIFRSSFHSFFSGNRLINSTGSSTFDGALLVLRKLLLTGIKFAIARKYQITLFNCNAEFIFVGGTFTKKIKIVAEYHTMPVSDGPGPEIKTCRAAREKKAARGRG